MLGEKLCAAIAMMKDIIQKVRGINKVRNALAATTEASQAGNEQLAATRAVYLRARCTPKIAINNLSEGGKYWYRPKAKT